MTVKARIYRPAHKKQLNKLDKYGKYNCSAYALAMYVDAVTLGGSTISGRAVRAASSEPVPDPASPGLNLPQLIAVARKLGIGLADQTGKSWDTLVGLLDKDIRLIIQISYAELGPYRCQGADFGHAMLIQARRKRPGGIPGWELLGNDPLCDGAKWYDDNRVKAAMDKFGDETHVPGTGLRFASSRVVPKIAVEVK